jgi:hypothetical protein
VGHLSGGLHASACYDGARMRLSLIFSTDDLEMMIPVKIPC